MSVRNILFATNPESGPPPVVGYNLYDWGFNNAGQLGLGDTTNRSSPTQIGSLTNWSVLNAGGAQIGALSS